MQGAAFSRTTIGEGLARYEKKVSINPAPQDDGGIPCHENKEPGESMGIPATAKCMGCHKSVKTDSPHIQKLAGFHGQNRPVPWVRIYQIPSYVFFSHKAHITAGGTCAECHGAVAEREVLRKEVPTNMGACMECHQKKKGVQ